MLSASSNTGTSFCNLPRSLMATIMAAVANVMPAMMDTANRPGSQVTRPGTSSAHMPVKCMAATPMPTTAPPNAARHEFERLTARLKPRPVMTTAKISESPVRPMS
jgi:hypothetical protein